MIIDYGNILLEHRDAAIPEVKKGKNVKALGTKSIPSVVLGADPGGVGLKSDGTTGQTTGHLAARGSASRYMIGD